MSKNKTKIGPLPSYLQYKELVDNLSKDVDAKVTGGVEKMENNLSASINEGLNKFENKMALERQKLEHDMALRYEQIDKKAYEESKKRDNEAAIERQKRESEAAIERQIAESRILGLENRLAQKVAENNKYQTKLLLSIMGLALTVITGIIGILFRKPLWEGFISLF